MDFYDEYIRTVVDYPIKGIKFRDITPLLANGDAFHQVIMDLNKELPSYEKWDKIIAAESSSNNLIPFFITRKFFI